MLALPKDSAIFSSDQRPMYGATVWDTPYTVRSKGIRFTPFDLFADPEPDDVGAEPETRLQNIRSVLRDPSKVQGVLGRDPAAPGEWRRGVAPNMYVYWGAGAPTGVSTAKATLLRYEGIAKHDFDGTLVFGGQGRVRAYVISAANGAVQEVSGTLREPRPGVDPTNGTQDINQDFGYVHGRVSIRKGDAVEVYYWHYGQPWGGLVAKAVNARPDAFDFSYDTPAGPVTRRAVNWDEAWRPFLSLVRDAPVISASFIGAEPGGAWLAGRTVPSVLSGSVSRRRGSAASCEIDVALEPSGLGSGWRVVKTEGGLTQLVDNATGDRLRKGLRIEFRAGYKRYTPLEANAYAADRTEEVYPRFTGLIDDIIVSDDGETAQVVCIGFEARLLDMADENLPHPVGCHAAGLAFREWVGEPVYGIASYDAWELETAGADLMAHAGIDSWAYGRDASANASEGFVGAHGKRLFLDTLTQRQHRGSVRFAARAMGDSGVKVRVERNSAYGNVGSLKRDSLPDDATYLFPPDPSARLWDRAEQMASHYGWDFFFDAEGQAVLGARNNPISFEYASSPEDRTAKRERVAATAIGGRYYRNDTVAVALDGKDDYIRIANSPSLNIAGETITIEAWVQIPAWPTSGTAPFLNKENAYEVGIGTDGSFQAAIRVDDGSATGIWQWLSSEYVVPTNTPIHLAVACDGENLHFVVNGALVAVKPNIAAGNLKPSDAALRLGARDSAGGPQGGGDGIADNFYACVVDEVRIWNTFRTEAEIAGWMRATIDAGTPGLVGNWRANLAGSVFTDTSGFGNHGRVYGGYPVVPGLRGWSKRFEGHFSRVDAYVGIGRDREPGENLLTDVDLSELRARNSIDGAYGNATPQGDGFWRVQMYGPAGVWANEVSITRSVSVVPGETYTESLLCRTDTTLREADIDFFHSGENHRIRARIIPVADRPGVYRVTAHYTVPDGVTSIRALKLMGISAPGARYVEIAEPEFRTASFNGGEFRAVVDRWNGAAWEPYITAANPVRCSSYYEGPAAYYYDGLTDGRGENLCAKTLFSLPFDRYRVTIEPHGPDARDGSAVSLHRLSGVAIYETDPLRSSYPQPLSTRKNALRLTPVSSQKDLRNHVIVVGQRRAQVTDSAKLQAMQNPANPGVEFHVEVATDPRSIYDPSAENFVGVRQMAVVVDSKVKDGDFARWLARAVLYRYVMPKDGARLTHTAIPALELGDALHAVEERNLSVNHTLWVHGFRESWERDDARVEIEAEAYPELPSYQPKEEVDIDGLFNGQAAVNLRIGYQNLYGEALTNAELASPDIFTPRSRATAAIGDVPMVTKAITSRAPFSINEAIIPETLFLSWNVDRVNRLLTQRSSYKRALVNNPYQRFWNVAGFDPATFGMRLEWDFQSGDGTPGVYDMDYWRFPNQVGQYYACYDHFANREGRNPFYDPYTSEVGNLVSVAFDALVSGWYRVSICAETPERIVPVAWLTNPQGDGTDADAHWAYVEAGADRTFLWDGIDSIGDYNRIQSIAFAERMAGAFGDDEAMVVGAGFYAWNALTTDLMTQIGDARPENYERSAAGEIVGPYFTVGRFSRFFVRIETQIDALTRLTPDRRERIVESRNLSARSADDLPLHPTEQAYIWTHLGEPTQVEMQIEDWDPEKLMDDGSGPVGDWHLGIRDDGWVRIEAVERDHPAGHEETKAARIRDGKPVRVRFSPRPRPGVLFEDGRGIPDPHRSGAMLVRRAHLQTTLFEQFWTFRNRPWDGVSPKNDMSVKEKRVTSRMAHNPEGASYTMEWRDQDYRTGQDIARIEWLFRPSDFRRDFGRGIVEGLRYGDYEQLESLAGYDPSQIGGAGGGPDRSYLTMAYLSYLVHLSAFTLDRSGRRQWCWNPTFVDQSKIVSPAYRSAQAFDPAGPSYRPEYAARAPMRGAERYLMRSIFCRQWVEPTWAEPNSAGQYHNGSPLSASHTGTGGYEAFLAASVEPGEVDFVKRFVQLPITDFDLKSDLRFPGAANPTRFADTWLEEYQTDLRWSDTVNDVTAKADNSHELIPGWTGKGSVLPTEIETAIRPPRFGHWHFDRGGLSGWFLPSPKRDFHPYWTQSMPDWNAPFTCIYTTEWYYLAGASQHLWEHQSQLLSARGIAQHILEMPAAQTRYPYRDWVRQSVWFGRCYGPEHEPGKRNKAPRLEEDVITYFQDRSEDYFRHAFDYAKQDELLRWENFRGVLARGLAAPTGKRKSWASWADGWPTINHGGLSELFGNTDNEIRTAQAQPVSASGQYLLNLGRYADLCVGPLYIIGSEKDGPTGHSVSKVSDWFAIRFRHELLWQSAYFFPVDGDGVARPELFMDEYTRAADFLGQLWWQKDRVPDHKLGFIASEGSRRVLYDPGAWVGWKDDIPADAWQQDAHLRWVDRAATTFTTRPEYNPATGGFPAEVNQLWPGGGGDPIDPIPANGMVEYRYLWYGNLSGHDPKKHRQSEHSWFRRANILDNYYSRGGMRLAVGPELRESRVLIMNLTLPTRLMGDGLL